MELGSLGESRSALAPATAPAARWRGRIKFGRRTPRLFGGGKGSAFERLVVPERQHDAYRHDAERGEQQQAAGIAAGLILDPSHRKRSGKSSEVADRIDDGDPGCRTCAGEEGG